MCELEDEVPRTSKSLQPTKKKRKPYKIETRYHSFMLDGAWLVWQRYEKELDRDKAYKILTKKFEGKNWIEFRSVED